MEHGCNVSATNNDGNTPMHLAATGGKKFKSQNTKVKKIELKMARN